MTVLVPRSHQRAATRAILDARAAGQPGFLLGDMTGLGKTLSVWAALAEMPEQEILIVCPRAPSPSGGEPWPSPACLKRLSR
ncbi:DEAD/DEAH box helicase family protein [Beijerinckia sp. L45]|uniref:DEAD/DEAH box helicase family protein n=1 Tax=Beijerinckia sp. L45 TaxID=1641855 RepID=UPI0034CF173B